MFTTFQNTWHKIYIIPGYTCKIQTMYIMLKSLSTKILMLQTHNVYLFCEFGVFCFSMLDVFCISPWANFVSAEQIVSGKYLLHTEIYISVIAFRKFIPKKCAWDLKHDSTLLIGSVPDHGWINFQT